MPVSYVPCLTPLILLSVPLFWMRSGRKRFLRACTVSAACLCFFLLWIFIPGWYLMIGAIRGNPASQFEYARWIENHTERVGAVILWPFEPDCAAGFRWLERAAKQDYPPAVYAVGVRLKHGWLVPPPEDWSGGGGYLSALPGVGQPVIDHAFELGYRPPVPEDQWYAWWREIPAHWN